MRSPYQRDRDRLVHSGAFRKLKHKTQVFIYHEGDYYRTRLSHSLEVAQIARTLARCLAVDEDLVEAISLAHDLGHTPFGHAGETALNAAMAPFGGFFHNDQTVRVLTRLEQRYADFDGLNLTWETLEGVTKHNGPLRPPLEGRVLPPTVVALDRAWPLDLDRFPSLEAQLAALADDIAYNNHDLDDGLRAGLFDLDELVDLPLTGATVREVDRRYPALDPRRRRHETIRRLIDRMVTDLLAETRRRLGEADPRTADAVRAANRPLAGFSDTMRQCDLALKAFLFDRMYRHPDVNRETSKARRVVGDLFSFFMAEPGCLKDDWRHAVLAMNEADRARVVADYIAGMTDRYALIEHQRLFDLRPRA